MYKLSTFNPDMSLNSVSSAEIIASLDRSVPLQLAHIRAVEALEKHGELYPKHGVNVLAAARAAIGKTEVRPWERRWVEAMAA